MADVFSQLYIQTVFAVKNRQALILPTWETDLYKYTTGIVENKGHKMLAIGGMPDHIHIFIGLKPAEAIADLVREIKNPPMPTSRTIICRNLPLTGRLGMALFPTADRTWMRCVNTF